MYDVSLFLHNWFRWVILIVGLTIIVKSFLASRKNEPYQKLDATLSLVLLIFCDINLLIGWYQWAIGPLGYTLFNSGMGEIMKIPLFRFFSVEHFIGMNIAVVLIHVTRVLVKKKTTDIEKHKTSWKFFALSIFIMLIMIPWPFREVGAGRSWFLF